MSSKNLKGEKVADLFNIIWAPGVYKAKEKGWLNLSAGTVACQ